MRLVPVVVVGRTDVARAVLGLVAEGAERWEGREGIRLEIRSGGDGSASMGGNPGVFVVCDAATPGADLVDWVSCGHSVVTTTGRALAGPTGHFRVLTADRRLRYSAVVPEVPVIDALVARRDAGVAVSRIEGLLPSATSVSDAAELALVLARTIGADLALHDVRIPNDEVRDRKLRIEVTADNWPMVTAVLDRPPYAVGDVTFALSTAGDGAPDLILGAPVADARATAAVALADLLTLAREPLSSWHLDRLGKLTS